MGVSKEEREGCVRWVERVGYASKVKLGQRDERVG